MEVQKLPSPSPTENEDISTSKLVSLLQQIKNHPSSSIFLEPVDPVKHNCPDYFEKIEKPMDLQKIQEKLQGYSDIQSFCEDVCLMLQNAFTYNPKGHFVRDHARELALVLDMQAIQHGHHIDWSLYGILDLQKTEDQKPRKRRLGSYKLRQTETINSELESLSSTLENMNKQLAKLEKQEKKKPKLMVDTTPHSSELSEVEEEIVPKKKPKAKRVINHVPKAERRCEYCGTNETPMWRRGPSGKASLCNKCGVKWRAGRVLQQADGTILPPPSPTTLSKPIKSSKSTPKRIQKAPQNVSYAQKEHVAQVLTLGTLNSDQLSHIVNMIRNSVPELRNSSEEIELDIEALDPSLVAQMYRYVVETVGLKPMS